MKQISKTFCLLGLIMLLALVIRIWGLGFGLPYLYHPDEPRYVISAQRLFQTHSLNPNTLPDIASSSFVYVINALAYGPYYWLGKLKGLFDNPAGIPAPMVLVMGVGVISRPSVFLLGRLVTALFGVANVGLTFIIGRQWLKSPTIGLLAALLLATSPTNVSLSRYITPDTFVVFFALLLFLEATVIYEQDKNLSYLAAGIALGCLISTKVNGGLALLPLLIAHFYRKGLKGLLDPKLYGLFAAGGLAFVITTPYLIGNFGAVLHDMIGEGQHYLAGHPGMEGNSLGWYLAYMWQTGGPIYILATLEVVRGIYLRSAKLILLSLFPVIYFAFISTFIVRNDRTLLPITPFAFLLAGSYFVYGWGWAKQMVAKAPRRIAIWAIICLSIVSFTLPIIKTVKQTIQLTRVDSRETGRVWIAENLLEEALIGIESYAPYVEPAHFSVQAFTKIIDHQPEWYIENGFEYLVFSQGMYGRFYREPERYATEVLLYEAFFKRFTLVKQLIDGGYEVRIYKIH